MDLSWVGYLIISELIPESPVHLITGDSQTRLLYDVRSHWQTGVLSFSEAAMPQMLPRLDIFQEGEDSYFNDDGGTSDKSRGEPRENS